MILKGLKLRGAFGIYDGLGVDDIEIDFTQFDPGLIAIYGPNGTGKTTLVENLTPFRSLWSRPGSLTKEFRLKDSRRELTASIEGIDYRFLLVIDGESKNGKIESFVYRGSEALNPDGKRDSYDEQVRQLIGSEDLFFRSVFMPQKRVSLYKLTPKARKDLILELKGQERIELLSSAAGDRAKNIRLDIEKLESKIATIKEAIESLGDQEGKIKEVTDAIVAGKELIEKTETLIGALEKERENLQARNTEQAVTQTKIVELEKQIGEQSASRDQLKAEHDKATKSLEVDIERLNDEYIQLLSEVDRDEIDNLKQQVERAGRIKTEYIELLQFSNKVSALRSDLTEAENNYKHAKQDHGWRSGKLVADLNRMQAAAEILKKVPCQADEIDDGETLPTKNHDLIKRACARCKFLTDAVKSRDQIPVAEEALEDARELWATRESKYNAELNLLRLELESTEFDGDAFKALEEEHKGFEQSNPAEKLRSLEKQITRLEELPGLIDQKAKEKESAGSEYEQKDTELQERISANVTLAHDLRSQIDSTVATALANTDEALAQKRRDLQTCNTTLSDVQAGLKQLEKDEEQRADKETELVVLKSQLRDHQSNLADWRHLSLGLSKNGGFQSYLVEHAAAEIMPFANDLLSRYDLQWNIEIQTSRQSADGKKDVDGFFVFINTPEGPRELGRLSGGQEVWIEHVIYAALANSMRQSGFRSQTQILDEADGALDADHAIDYLRAVEAAHAQSGLHHTLMISHRPEIQQAIPQRLRLVPGEGVRVELE